MWRYRMRVILLSLGVIVGYGSAFAHFSHVRHRIHGAQGECWPFAWHDDWDAAQPKPVK